MKFSLRNGEMKIEIGIMNQAIFVSCERDATKQLG